jgi:hypothetical protein
MGRKYNVDIYYITKKLCAVHDGLEDFCEIAL